MKQSVCVQIFCIFVIFSVVAGCEGTGTTGNGNPVDGDVSADGDEETGEGMETMEEDLETSDKADGSEDGDIDAVDGDDEVDLEDDGEIEDEGETGDAEETAEDEEELEQGEVDVEMEEEQQASAPRFTGLTASGGTAASERHRLIFRMAPAAMVVKASNGTVNLNAVITPRAK